MMSNKYKMLAIYIGNQVIATAAGDFEMKTCGIPGKYAYLEFDKHTALVVAEQLYKYYQSKNKGDDEIIRDTLKETATPMFAESEDRIIQLALKCLRAYALKQLVTRESEQ